MCTVYRCGIRLDKIKFNIINIGIWTNGSISSLPSKITSAADSEAVTYRKLVKGHAYSVTGAEQVSTAHCFETTLQQAE